MEPKVSVNTGNNPKNSKSDITKIPNKKKIPQINTQEIFNDIGNEYISEDYNNDNNDNNNLMNKDMLNEMLKKKADEKKSIYEN